jgi:hypothetical protein
MSDGERQDVLYRKDRDSLQCFGSGVVDHSQRRAFRDQRDRNDRAHACDGGPVGLDGGGMRERGGDLRFFACGGDWPRMGLPPCRLLCRALTVEAGGDNGAVGVDW